MTHVVTAVELARRVGVSPKTFRGWLRRQAQSGNVLVMRHLHYECWKFDPDEADELARQFRDRTRRSSLAAVIPSAPESEPNAQPDSEVERAIEALSADAPPLRSPDDAPACPGLYSTSAQAAAALQDLGLEDVEGQTPLLERILYLGKAEDSLQARLSRTHFKTEKTGWSTLRRTLAALLDLESRPRPSRITSPTPEQLRTMTSNYGLTPSDEKRLTDWMSENLSVRVFAADPERLEELERSVGAVLRPPLDQERTPMWSPNPWRAQVATARAMLRDRARQAARVGGTL